MTPKVAVLSGFGINCETETMAVFEMSGARADKVHVNRLVNGELNLSDYQIMAIPGGFSFGDHLGSGRLMGNRLRFGFRVPVRHGEGKFVTDDPNLMDRWAESGQLVARYVDPSNEYPSASDNILPYPISPNQSWRNVAGVCDPTGLVFGLMPHPEANHSTWLGATWTREENEHGQGEGMAIFHNAVSHVMEA